MTIRSFSLSFVALGLAATSLAQMKTYTIVNDPKHKLAQVESKTAVETFTGKSTAITGSFSFDAAKKVGRGTLQLPVASIDTGIPLRNEHLQDTNWLNAAKNPNIRFVSQGTRHLKGDEYEVTGNFTMNGVTKQIKTKAIVRQLPASAQTRELGFKGDVLRVETSFPITLKDFNVIIKGQAVGKVSETVNVKISVFAQTG